MIRKCKSCARAEDDHNVRHPFVSEPMTTEAIREARKSFAAQLTNMIRDFEGQTGVPIAAINIERSEHKRFGQPEKHVSLFRGVFVSLDIDSDLS